MSLWPKSPSPCILTFTWDLYPLCPCTSTFSLCLLRSWGGNGAMWDMWWQQVQKTAGGAGTKLPPVHVIHATWPQWEAILSLRGKLENQTSRKDCVWFCRDVILWIKQINGVLCFASFWGLWCNTFSWCARKNSRQLWELLRLNHIFLARLIGIEYLQSRFYLWFLRA